MAASRDILFWTPRGQLLRNQRIIPVTNISELVECVLLPHNDDVVKPRALKTFIDGLAELGINKRLIQNEKILAELMEKERAYRDKDSEAGDEEMVSESSDNEDDTETVSEYSELIKSQKTLIWNLKEIQTLHILKKAQVQRFCLKEKALATIATAKTFTKVQ